MPRGSSKKFFLFGLPGGGGVATNTFVTITDNFTGADTASINGRTTTTGNKTWVVVGGTGIGITTNQAAQKSAGDQYAYVDGGVADTTPQIKIVTLAGAGYLLFRFTDTSNHFITGCNSTTLVAYQKVAGSYTSIGTSTIAAGDTLLCVMSSTSLIIKKNGTAVITTTNSNHTTATKNGLFGLATACIWDDYQQTVP